MSGSRVKYHIDPKELYLLYVEDKMSTVDIAKHFGFIKPDGTPNAMCIHRALERANIPIRNKAEAQKLALETGKARIPTQGRVRTEKERLRIGVTMIENYKSASETEKKRRRKGVEEFWKNKDNKDAQEEAIRKRGQQLQKTITEGTILEQTLARNLIDWGYNVKMHDSKMFDGELEADIVAIGKGISVTIEIDGKRHWGQFMNNTPEDLARIIQTDQKKNGIVLAIKKMFMLRILWPFGSKTVHLTSTLRKVHEVLEYFQAKALEPNPPIKDRIVFLDMGQVINGKKCTNNPHYRKAIEIIKKGG